MYTAKLNIVSSACAFVLIKMIKVINWWGGGQGSDRQMSVYNIAKLLFIYLLLLLLLNFIIII